MQSPWWKQLLIGLALFLAGYFMFGGGQTTQTESQPKVSVTTFSTLFV